MNRLPKRPTIVFCQLCGAYASCVPKKLAIKCPGQPIFAPSGQPWGKIVLDRLLAFKHPDDANAQVEIVSFGQAASNAIRPLARPFGSCSVNNVALPENEPVNSQEVLNLVAVRTAFQNRAARYGRQRGGRLEDVMVGEPLEPFTQSSILCQTCSSYSNRQQV